MAAGELKKTSKRRGRWGDSVVLEMQDGALALDGVDPGDFVVVNQSPLVPTDDALVVMEEKKAGPAVVTRDGRRIPRKPASHYVLRKLEYIGDKVRLLPGSSLGQNPYIDPAQMRVWGTVVAVMRKFEAA